MQNLQIVGPVLSENSFVCYKHRGAAHKDKWWEKNPRHPANLNNGNNFPLHLTSRLRGRLPQRPPTQYFFLMVFISGQKGS